MRSQKLFAINVAIAAGVLLVGGGAVRAQGWNSCSARIRQDQWEVQQAADRYGYNSQQAQHERAELQRDVQNCGYNYSVPAYNDRDRDDGYYHNGGDRDDQNYYGRYNPPYDNGYRDGVAMGQKDGRNGKAFRPRNNDQYEDADRGYKRNYGDKNFYKNQYRLAFERGYADGYGSWR